MSTTKPILTLADISDLSDAQLLSMAHDGELPISAHAGWQRLAQMSDALAQAATFQRIGDSLRATQTNAPSAASAAWMNGLQERLAKEPQHTVASGVLRGEPAAQAAAPPAALPSPAANDRFWKRVAGGSLAAGVCAVALGAAMAIRVGPSAAPALATSTPPAVAQTTQAVLVSDGANQVLRDPRLVERMLQHRQFGSAGAMGSAAFVRHATYEPTPNGGN